MKNILQNTTDSLFINSYRTKIICFVNIIFILVCSAYYFMDKIIFLKHKQYNKRKQILKKVHKSVSENNVLRSLELLRKYPETINTPLNVDGYTPFLRACLNGNSQLVQFMLNLGANIKIRSRKQESGFYLATFNRIKNFENKDASCLHTLYYAGADINLANNTGYSPLHLAAMFGHTSLTRWLVTKGANCDVYPDPYVLAYKQGHYETSLVLKNKRLRALE